MIRSIARFAPGLLLVLPTGSDPVDRIVALETARSLGEGELYADLARPESEVRRRAALALGRIQDRAATRPLLAALEDGEPHVVREAAIALGQIGDPEAREGLEQVSRGGDAEARALAAEALGRIGAAASLKPCLADPDARVRGEAALGLWRSKAVDPGSALVSLLSDSEPGVRWRAAYALMQLKLEPSALRNAALDPEPLVRGFACRGLSEAPGPESEAVLVERLSDPEWTVAVEAAKALAKITAGAEPTGRALERAIRASRGAFHVRREAALAAASALAKRDDPALRAALREAAHSDPSRAVRGAALSALVRCESEEAAKGLIGLARPPRDAWARVCIAEALAARKAEWGIPALIYLASDPDLQVREASLTGLAAFDGSSEARAALVAAASVRDLGIRGTAIEALSGLKSPELSEAIVGWFADSSGSEMAEVRAICLEALAKTEGTKVVGLLAAALSDPDVMVRARAQAMLRSVTGLEYRFVPILRGPLAEPDDREPVVGRTAVRFETEKGSFTIETFPEEAPIRVRRFLADASRGFFDGLTIHRVVSNFVVQGGDPRGDGWGGGTNVPEEIGRRHFERGSVGTPTSGKDTGGSQLFICHGPTPHLDGRYTIFGRVKSGMDVVDQLEPKDRIWKATVER